MKKIVNKIINLIDSKFDSGIIIIVTCIPLIIVGIHLLGLPAKAPVREDGVGYYAYLPAVFIYQDLNFDFLIDADVPYSEGINSFERKFNPREAKVMGFNPVDDKRVLDKYPIGVSVMLSPFFVLGHVFSLIFGTTLSGWSFFYQYFCAYGGIVYFLSGLVFLKKLLQKYFDKWTTLFSLFVVVFGTSLFNYATYENIFSHVYSFFLINFILFFTPKWLEKLDVKHSMLLGSLLGLLFLVRNTNILFFVIPPLYGILSISDFKRRINLLLCNYQSIAALILALGLVVLPQFVYWKYASGDWIAYSYGDEGFRFFNPQILNVLFSSKKGLFFWAPVLLFSLPGIFLLKGKVRKYLIPGIVVFFLQVYLVSSWWSWQYGWSYGHRAFVDMSGVFAIGFASLYGAIKNYKLKIIVTVISALMVLLSTFQMGQYWLKILPPAETTFEDYKKVFLNLDMDLRYYWTDRFRELDN